MIISYFVMMLLIISTLGKNCDDIICANVDDVVCGMAESEDGTQIIMKYKNICYMKKKACELEEFVEINQVADELCNIKKEEMMTERDDNDQDVTIQPLGKCYKNPSGLLFMQHVAAMKSLKLLEDDHIMPGLEDHIPERRTDVVSRQQSPGVQIAADVILKEQLLEVVRRIFEKYRKGFN